ncbi:FxSxx-COOH system tetratricopeptide repeat protein [Micromonospora chalcea]|uniref:FxSxx-COOH system tetratricopeptide repeat protein n=1 Tax=Micromonospora chalcea TaxID=1874 RepID=UPI0033DEEC71
MTDAIDPGPTAGGTRSIAIGTNTGTAISGDNAKVLNVSAGALRAPDKVPMPARLASLPRSPADPFVGREADLQLLGQALHLQGASVVTQAVYGLGGVGKSELALQYAARHAEVHPLIWWASAEDCELLHGALANLARRLEPAHALLGTTTADAAEWATQWLQCHSGWLLILDNVEDHATVAAFLGQVGRHGRVIMTTRRDINWRGSAKPLLLDVLTSGASVELLIRLVGSPDEAEALEYLAAELGYLPLALEQAGAYIAEQRITVAKYLMLLREKPAETFQGVDEGGQASRTIARVWDITLEAIRGKDPRAELLLRVMAYFAPDSIPRRLLGADASAADSVDKALGILASYSMITLDQQRIVMHRLVQAVLREQDNGLYGGIDHTKTPAATATRILTSAAPDGDPHTNIEIWPAWRELMPHIDALTRAINDDQATVETAALLAKSAFFASTQGEHNVALPQERRALAIAEARLGPHHPVVGTTLLNLGQTLTALGKPAEALPLLQRGLAITEAVHGPEHPDVAIGLSHLARTMTELGRAAEALPLRRRELAISEAAFAPDHPTVAIALNNLAGTLEALGKSAEALPLRERALAISEAAFGPDHPTVAIRLGNLAVTLTTLGRPADALPLHRRSLAISEAVLGSDHPELAARLNNLALTFDAMGKAAEALPLRERALTISEAAFGPDHPTIGVRLNNLAQTLNDLGKPAEALPLQQRALAISEAALGPSHPTIAVWLGNLAQTVDALGRAAEALPLRERALAISETALGPDHPDVAKGLLNLGGTLITMSRASEALPLLQRALPIIERALGPKHPIVAIALGNLAHAFQDLGQIGEALPLQERALAISEAALGSDHPQVATGLNNLAGTLAALGKAVEALPLQQRALAISEAALGSHHPVVAIRLNILAQTLDALGRPAETLPLLQRALAISEAALGPDHPDIAIRLSNLAHILKALDRKSEAVPLLQRALAISEAAQGPDHPTTAAIRRTLGLQKQR